MFILVKGVHGGEPISHAGFLSVMFVLLRACLQQFQSSKRHRWMCMFRGQTDPALVCSDRACIHELLRVLCHGHTRLETMRLRPRESV